ncbi:MAG: DinB family protein [Planctomycetota bacterium]
MSTTSEALAAGVESLAGRFDDETRDIEDEEWLARPEPGLHSIAWMLGHAVILLARLAGAVDRLPSWKDEFLDEAVVDEEPDRWPNLGQLRKAMRGQIKHLAAAWRGRDDGAWGAPASDDASPPARTLAQATQLSLQHLSSHLGRIGVLLHLIRAKEERRRSQRRRLS